LANFHEKVWQKNYLVGWSSIQFLSLRVCFLFFNHKVIQICYKKTIGT
jgi:hypothetical protein